LNPFVPTVDGFVLPPPTNRRIRQLRRANFEVDEPALASPRRRTAVAHEENRPSYVSCHSLPDFEDAIDSANSPLNAYSTALQEIPQPRNQLDPIPFSTQHTSPAEVIAANQRAFQSQKQCWQKMQEEAAAAPTTCWDANHGGSKHDSNLRQKEPAASLHQNEPRGAMQRELAESRANFDHGARPPISHSRNASLHSWRENDAEALKAENRDPSVVNPEVLHLAPREPAYPTPGRFPIDSLGEEQVSRIRPHRCRPHEHAEGVTCSRISYERYPIDGYDGGYEYAHRSLPPREKKGTQPVQLIQRGRDILRHMPKIFRKHRKNKQTNGSDHNTDETATSHLSGIFRRKSSPSGWCTTATEDSPPKAAPKRDTLYSFDGACDEDDTITTKTMSSVDLNKALPPQPLLLKNRGTVSIRTDTPSLSHSHETHTRPSTASTKSSELSRASSKKQFHRTAHSLTHPEMSESRHSSLLHESDTDKFLVGSKYDPPASSRLPDTYVDPTLSVQEP
jgi:hypothetical protein